MKSRQAVSFLIIFSLLETASSCSVASPRNTVTVVGEQLDLECRTGNNSYVRDWSVTRYQLTVTGGGESSTVRETIFTNWYSPGKITKEFSHFSADVDSSGSGLLRSVNPSLQDAGTYTCLVEVEGSTRRCVADVVILQTKPQCEANFNSADWLEDGSRSWMKCSVKYKGIWSPVIQWRMIHQSDGDGNNKILSEGTSSVVVLEHNITSTLDVLVNKHKNNSYFTASLSFTKRNRNPSDNVPFYNFTWASPVINVQSNGTVSVQESITMISTSTTDALFIGLGAVGVVFLVFISLLLVGLGARRFKDKPLALAMQPVECGPDIVRNAEGDVMRQGHIRTGRHPCDGYTDTLIGARDAAANRVSEPYEEMGFVYEDIKEDAFAENTTYFDEGNSRIRMPVGLYGKATEG